MKVFAGRYSWDGKKHSREEPIAWFPGSYNLKIFNIGERQKGVQHLKPYICIYSATGEGVSISANPERFARHICHDFSLDMDKVLWVEEMQAESGDFEVVVFTKQSCMGNICFYSIGKRQPLPGEKRNIEQELAGLR